MSESAIQININGKLIKDYNSLCLKQKINSHHHFRLVVDLENIELEGAHTIDKSKDWLGKTITITTHERDFVGIVTSVHLSHDNGHHGQIIIKGFSSTIVLENGKHIQSWLKKPLQTIVEAVTKHPKVSTMVKPEYTTEIAYETQYLETNFQFLQRLAKQYHEWLYYDGDTLFFGKPAKSKAIKLIYGVDITDLQIGIQTQARKYKSFSYNSFVDEQYTSESPDNPTGLNELGQLAFNASLENYSDPTNVYSQMRVNNKADLDFYLKKKQQSDYASSNFISIRTAKRGLTVGDIIDLRSEVFKVKGKFLNKRHGEYIITEITHYATVGNDYSNTIVALPADIKTLPEPVVNFPIAETQMAIVVDNEDPDGKGRVQVKMAWQTEEMKTPWIRVLTPNAGKSDKVSTNRGFVFIPEKGDQVLVSFRYNDPNRPFVLGSLFNGKTGVGGSDHNKIKSITTRSGSTIVFDDDNEKGSILVKDADGNLTCYDGKGNIVVSANETITLNVGKSSLHMNKDGTIIISGQNASVVGEKNVLVLSAPKDSSDGSSLSLTPTKAGLSGKTSLSMQGGNKAGLSSKETNIAGEDKVKVAGGEIKLN